MTSQNPTPLHECGIALPQLTGAGAGVGSGYAVVAYNGAGAYTGTAIPWSSGRYITFLIGAATLAGVTRIGFHVQGTNDDLSGSPTWTNVAPHASVQSGRWPSISPTILGVAFASAARTPPNGPALTAEQTAIEARRLVRFAANLQAILTIDTELTGYKHHRIVINEVVGAAAPVFAMYYKFGLRESGSAHPYSVPGTTIVGRPGGFTDAEFVTFLDTGELPSTITDQMVINDLSMFKPPLRPAGLTDAQWARHRSIIWDEMFGLQHRPDGV